MRIETHVHTSPASACARHSVADMLRAATACGGEAVCLTDHGTLEGFLSLAPGDVPAGLVVVPGIEATIDDWEREFSADVLVLAGTPEALGPLDTADRHWDSLDAFRAALPAAGRFVIWAHPLGGLGEGGLLRPGILELLSIVDAVEAWNGKRGSMAAQSPAVFAAARKMGLRETAGSDAHAVSEAGEALTLVEGTAGDAAGVVVLLRTARLGYDVRDPGSMDGTGRLRGFSGREPIRD